MDFASIVTHLGNFIDTWEGWGKVSEGWGKLGSLAALSDAAKEIDYVWGKGIFDQIAIFRAFFSF